jgi:hypothetical protein
MNDANSTDTKMTQNKAFLINNDIADVISGGSNEENIKIQKIHESGEQIRYDNMQDKIELSSNKDVTIGLDLLVNKDKMAKREDGDNVLDPIDLNDVGKGREEAVDIISKKGNVINLNTHVGEDLDFSFNNTNANQLIDDLHLDRTSRLSQDAIDAIIDDTDAKEANRHGLVDIQDTVISISDKDPETEHHDNRHDNRNDNRHDNRNDNRNDDDYESYRKPQQYDGRDTSDRYDAPRHRPRDDNYNQSYYEPPRRSPEEMLQEKKDKEEILWQLEKYRRLGVQGSRKFNMSSDLLEMQSEYNKIKKQRELESSVKFQRKCLVAFATGTELLNNKLDILDFRLDGWSEQVNEGIDEYNEVFEELHEKYKEKAQIAPELKLLFMMGGSAFMYHITNSMFKNSVPGMEDIMKQNPELMKQFANAAINQMDSDKQPAAKFFNNFAPGQQYTPPQSGFPTQPRESRQPPHIPTHRNIPQSSRPAPVYTQGGNPMPQNVRGISEISDKPTMFNNGTRKIPAPVGVDDILNELKSNTDDLISRDSVSDVVSRSSRRVNGGRKINLSKGRPSRSINLNLS